MVAELNERDRQIIKLKAAGKSNSEIGKIVYPKSTPGSQTNMVQRALSKTHVAQYYEQEKVIALKNAGITWDRVTQVINDALTAVTKNGEPAHSIRMRAAEMARGMLDVEEKNNTISDADKLKVSGNAQRIADGADEVEISRLMFRKSDNSDLNGG